MTENMISGSLIPGQKVSSASASRCACLKKVAATSYVALKGRLALLLSFRRFRSYLARMLIKGHNLLRSLV